MSDDCHCVIAKYDGDADPMLDYLCMTRHGDDDIDEIPDFTGYAMRWRNGDVCVVPTGEDTIALGYSDEATWDYAGLFLGGFLNNAPTPGPTRADFRGRRVAEDLQSAWISHTCFDVAQARGLNPTGVGCYRSGPGAPFDDEWNVDPVQVLANHHGRCTGSAGNTEHIGFGDFCAAFYATNDVGDPSPCTVTNSQRMAMYCRGHQGTNGKSEWNWLGWYESSPYGIGWTLDSIAAPSTWSSWRNGVYAGPRAVGSAASCIDPMWGP